MTKHYMVTLQFKEPNSIKIANIQQITQILN
jgi:hypothetical protein